MGAEETDRSDSKDVDRWWVDSGRTHVTQLG